MTTITKAMGDKPSHLRAINWLNEKDRTFDKDVYGEFSLQRSVGIGADIESDSLEEIEEVMKGVRTYDEKYLLQHQKDVERNYLEFQRRASLHSLNLEYQKKVDLEYQKKVEENDLEFQASLPSLNLEYQKKVEENDLEFQASLPSLNLRHQKEVDSFYLEFQASLLSLNLEH